MAADVVALRSASTVLGTDVAIKIEGDKVTINDAQVIVIDIEASNGVIHVIDTVILPQPLRRPFCQSLVARRPLRAFT